MATVSVVIVGAAIYATAMLSAGDTTYPEQKDNAGLTPADHEPDYVRPNEDGATSLESARQRLAGIDAIARAIEAVENSDVDALLEASPEGNYCDRAVRGGQPSQCPTGASYHPAAYIQTAFAEPILVPSEELRRYLEAVVARQPVALTLIAREAGRYYLVFKAAQAVHLDGSDYDGIGLVVDPDAPQPVQWFRFFLPENNGVEWLQIRAREAEGSPRFELVAPESVQGWPGLWGERGD